jgi:hypothetical protein
MAHHLAQVSAAEALRAAIAVFGLAKNSYVCAVIRSISTASRMRIQGQPQRFAAQQSTGAKVADWFSLG